MIYVYIQNSFYIFQKNQNIYILYNNFENKCLRIFKMVTKQDNLETHFSKVCYKNNALFKATI